MAKFPYIILLILIIGAVITVMTSRNDPISENLTQVVEPSPTPISDTGLSGQVLGEEAPITVPLTNHARILTEKGEIVIALFSDAAPNTVKNFAEKARSGFYNNLTFHRVENWVLQGGDPLGNGTGGGQMPTELNNNPFIRGSVGVARKNNIEISNDSQFFITKTESPHLNSQYTNFGQVTEGMDVVDSMQIGDSIISITVE